MNWTKERDQFLRENYRYKTAKEIACELGCTIKAVRARLFKLKVKLPKSIRYKRSSSGWFKKDCVPWNKDMKGLRHKPHNTKYDGCISIRERIDRNGKRETYKYIRIAEGKWLLLHRYIWENVHGEIGKGQVLRFKNGDTLDVRLENLELIDQAENLRRNLNRKKMSETMKKVWDSGKFLEKDTYIAGLLANGDQDLKQLLLKEGKHIIETKRQQLMLKREIRNADQ